MNPEMYFILSDGRPVKNLLELAEVMEDMDYEVFYNHVNEEKNDFASWTENVFGQNSLAEKLRSTKSKHKHQFYILKHLIKR